MMDITIVISNTNYVPNKKNSGDVKCVFIIFLIKNNFIISGNNLQLLLVCDFNENNDVFGTDIYTELRKNNDSKISLR